MFVVKQGSHIVALLGALMLLPVLPARGAKPLSDLRQRIGTIAEEARGHVGVAAVVLETGESIGLNERDISHAERLQASHLMAVLAKVDRGELTLDQKVQ